MPISQQGSGGLKADALTGADHKDLGHGVADLHTVAFEPVHGGIGSPTDVALLMQPCFSRLSGCTLPLNMLYVPSVTELAGRNKHTGQ